MGRILLLDTGLQLAVDKNKINMTTCQRRTWELQNVHHACYMSAYMYIYLMGLVRPAVQHDMYVPVLTWTAKANDSADKNKLGLNWT